MADEFDIRLDETDTKGVFTLFAPKPPQPQPVKSGEMTFSKAGTKLWIIDHTQVDDHMAGKGAAAALVARGVEEARMRGRKIIPLCPYAKKQFEAHAEYQDVWNH